MIPNYSNWLAKRVWAVNQSRAGGAAPASSEPDYAAWTRAERESRRSAARYLEKNQKLEGRLHRKWLKDKSRKQRELDYSYLGDVFSGTLGVRVRKAHPVDSWEQVFSKVHERIRDIGAKYEIDLEAHAAKRYPHNYHKERGDQLLKSQDPEGALREYNSATQSGGEESAVTYVNQSSAYLMQDRLEDCERACRKALSIDPNSAGAHFNLGQVAAARGDGPTAERYLRKAMDLDDKIRRQLQQMGL